MALSFEQIRALVQSALMEQYPAVAQGDNEPYPEACRFYISRMWPEKAFVRRGYYSQESDPQYGLVPYAIKEQDGDNYAVALDPMVSMKLQAVSDDGKTAVEIESANVKEDEISEAGRRNSKKDAKTINAAARALINLLDQEDLDEETIGAINRLIAKPQKTTTSEAWHGEEGETITETLVGVIEGTFDKKNLVIKDHVVLGPLSKNGYRYPVATQEAAIKGKIFEGAKAYINHPTTKEMGEARDVRDLIGEHRNVRLKGDKTYSDLHLVNNRTVQDHILPVAEKHPHLIGSSVVIRGKMKQVKDDLPEIEAIYACRSIDLVSEPATTNGLYESEKTKKVVEDMELKDLTLEQLRTRPELIEAILAEAGEKKKVVELEAKLADSTAKLKESEEKRVAAELKEAKALIDTEIDNCVREAKIPDSVKFDEKNGKREIKSHLLGILQRCKDTDERKKVIADWEEVYKAAPAPKTPTTGVFPEQVLTFGRKQLDDKAMGSLYAAINS